MKKVRMEDSRDGDEKRKYDCRFCRKKFIMLKQLEFHLSICAERRKLVKVARHSSPLNENKSETANVKDQEEAAADVPRWLDGVSNGYFQARRFAEASLEFFNQHQQDNQYDLVEPGPQGAPYIAGGPIIHVNFKGKPRGCPGAQAETFFSQIRMHPARVVDCCVSLGPSSNLPHWAKADNRGCSYCRGVVHHPVEKCDKLIMGINREEANWLYGEIHDSEDSADYYDTSDSDDSDSEGSSTD